MVLIHYPHATKAHFSVCSNTKYERMDFLSLYLLYSLFFKSQLDTDSILQILACLVYQLIHSCSKIHDRSNVRKVTFIWAQFLRIVLLRVLYWGNTTAELRVDMRYFIMERDIL